MNEAIGNALLMKIAIFIIMIVMLLFVGSLAYSKAYKSKNSIVEAIENNGGYDNAVEDIEESLSAIGYLLANDNCNLYKAQKGWTEWTLVSDSDYDYCVYKKCLGEEKKGKCDNRGEYYKVVTFMDITVPVVNKYLRSGVVGETKVLGKNFNY